MSDQPASVPMNTTAWRWAVLLPYLAALVLPLGQLAANASLLPSWSKVITVVGAVLLVAAVFDIGTRFFLRSSPTRPLVAVVLIFGFFAYGHVQPLVFMQHTFFSIAWAMLLFLAVSRVSRMEQRSTRLSKIMNGLRVFLTVAILCQVSLLVWKLWPQGSVPSELAERHDVSPAESLPDIYYIILDGYGREDVLKETYEFDNSAFLEQLRQRGFFVASQSYSNYGQTALSLASSLNLDYVETIVQGRKNLSRLVLRDLIVSSRLDAMLKDAGYRTVSIDSGYSFTNRFQSDEFLTPSFHSSDEVERALINTTALLPVMNWFAADALESHRRHLLSTFELVADAARSPGPEFVFAHFVAPHPPFVFDASGRNIDPGYPFTIVDGDHLVEKLLTQDQYRKRYIDQLRFVNKKTLEMIDRILAKSKGNAVVIIQSDHGPGSGLVQSSAEDTDLRERFAILNAIHLTPGQDMGCYEGQSPVNSFRLLCNELLGTEFDRLPDRTFFAGWDTPFQTIDITARLDSSPTK